MSIFDRKPVLRWLAPVAALAVIGGAGGVVAATATAGDRLPSRSAAELLVDLQQAQVDGLSGTVVQKSNLGIPAIPGAGGSDDASLTSLISGTHTLDVWYSGDDKARLRVRGSLDETDVVKNGNDLWTWSYKDKTATKRTLTETKPGQSTQQAPADLPKTPQEAASRILSALDPTTEVSTSGTQEVAGRPVYELVLQPKDADSLVTQVRIAIDGTEHIPLRVEVLTGAPDPAFEVAYTDVDFSRPDDAQFTFNPPPGTKVTTVAPETAKPHKAPSKAEIEAKKKQAAEDTKVVGEGWSTVVVTKLPAGDADKSAGQMEQVLSSLPKVSGDWGSGRLLKGTAFTAVLTDDGRLAVGSVKPELLYDALGK
jgi:outer membrane lipoprotein-sorting protein